jgi:hypothetical protein
MDSDKRAREPRRRRLIGRAVQGLRHARLLLDQLTLLAGDGGVVVVDAVGRPGLKAAQGVGAQRQID